MNKRTVTIAAATAGVAIILILYVLIVRGILSERTNQAVIEERIAQLELALTGQQQGAQALTARQTELKELQAELAQAEFAFPNQLDSTEVLDYIITAAADNAIVLNQVEAREPTTGTIGSSAYLIFAYDVEAEGALNALSTFFAALESGEIETLTLDQIRLEAQEAEAVYRATLVVQVYFRY